MRYPTDNNRITSQYGYRMLGTKFDFHGGTDYGAINAGVIGDKLFPIVDNSKVVYTGFDQWRGHNIILEHDMHCTRYNHLKAILVKEGDIVHEKDVIGIMGNSGNSTAAHLHFEVHRCKYDKFHQKWPNGEARNTIDPEMLFLEYMPRPAADCKTEELIDEMQEVINKYN